jgi:quercetin dioxygenase-like cupin family protein
MVGAVLSHLLLIGGSPAPALVLGCFAALILWGRFATVKAWLGGPSATASSTKEGVLTKAGDVFENPVTGERAVVRIGTEQTDGELLVADLYIRPGGAVMGEHLHPALEERFTVLHGRVGFRLSGRTSTAEPGVTLVAPCGTPHDWWNAGAEEALVRVEVRPGPGFAAFIVNAFGLAQDGRVDRRGMPKLLQMSLFAREFDDVIQFTRPPRVVQQILFGLLAPLARLLGYRGSYPEYSIRGPSEFVAVEPLNVAAVAVPGSAVASLSNAR